MVGKIIKGIGGFYYVKTDDTVVECKARGKFRNESLVPTIGDYVEISSKDGKTGAIEKILDRKNILLRPTVSNVDQIAIVISAAAPQTDFLFVDKITAMAEAQGIQILICINKSDLDCGENFKKVYNGIYTVINVSAKDGKGIDELKLRLMGKTTVFTGMSGVGKSSLLMKLTGFDVEVGEISLKTERGKHTTRHVEMFDISDDTILIDTPGFSSLDIDNVLFGIKDTLDCAFPEFEQYKCDCRFFDCKHLKGNNCGVISAVLNGNIAKSRYESYLILHESLKKIHSWDK